MGKKYTQTPLSFTVICILAVFFLELMYKGAMRCDDLKKTHMIYNLLLGLCCLLVASMGYAQSQVSVTKRPTSKKISTDFRTQVGAEIQALSYSSDSIQDNSLQQKAQIDILTQKSGLLFSEAQVSVGTYSEPQSFYYAFPNLYLGYGTKQSKVIVGRKKENLSWADSVFNLGLMQSHVSQDNVSFVQGGLTGLSYQMSNTVFGFQVSYMPLFIPNQGPQIKAEDGKVISYNRWANTPPAQFQFGAENRDIVYAIRDYSITDILLNSGYLASFYLGDSAARPLFRLTYAYKPINELALNRDTYADISDFKGYVFLSPVVLHHEVVAADLNYDSGSFKSSLSFIADQPKNKLAVEQETMQTLSPMSVTSIYLAFDLSSSGRNAEIYGALAAIEGGDIRDLNQEGSETAFSFKASRSLYKRPLKLGIKSDLVAVYNRPLMADVQLVYDDHQQGSMLNAMLNYTTASKMSLYVGADVIGSASEENNTDASAINFLVKNQANDRIFTGLKYVF